MTGEDFVKAIKIQTSDAAVSGTLDKLNCPSGRKPRETDILLSNWYNSLSLTDQAMIKISLKAAAELAVFSFLGILDGVAVITDSEEKGELTLTYRKNNETFWVNNDLEEPLHDLYNRICQNQSL